MHYLTGVPLAVAIPVVVEPGKLAGPAKPGATPHAQPGAAALPLETSFRARLQTMFAADIQASKTAWIPNRSCNPGISRLCCARWRIDAVNPRPRGRRRWFRPASARRKPPPTPARTVLHVSLSTVTPQPPPTPTLPASPQLPVKEWILERIPFRFSRCPYRLLLPPIGRRGRSLRSPAWAAIHRRHRLFWYLLEHSAAIADTFPGARPAFNRSGSARRGFLEANIDWNFRGSDGVRQLRRLSQELFRRLH